MGTYFQVRRDTAIGCSAVLAARLGHAGLDTARIYAEPADEW